MSMPVQGTQADENNLSSEQHNMGAQKCKPYVLRQPSIWFVR